ncbi:hypothetical protein Bbelb_181190 [Branchiostoma belcheri]|nr:hypothetical protein Bbelb_181190 [Branchiostoma belcheri]
MLILFAFSCGMNQLYWSYGTMHHYLCSNYTQSNLQSLGCSKSLGFDTLMNSFQSLSWASFGLIDLSVLDLKPGTSPVKEFQIHEWPAITETTGKLVFGFFEVIGVLILINLLIAIMSDSYTRTEEVKRTDWAFVVMRDVLRYMNLEVSLPPPFALIMSVRNALVRLVLSLCCRRNNTPDSDNNVERAVHPSQSPQTVKQDVYKMVVGSLKARYLLRKERGLE